MRNRILRIAGIALILTLVVGLIPMVPALAAQGSIISLSPSQGYAGQTVTIIGKDFTLGSTPYIWWQGTQISSSPTTVNATGYFTTYFTVPYTYPRGYYTITVTTSAGDTTVSGGAAQFLVTPVISPPASGSVGDQIKVLGYGFTASSYVTLQFLSIDQVTVLAQVTTTAYTNGAIEVIMTVPQSPRGNYTIKAIGAAYETTTSYFSIMSKVTVTPTTAAVGEPVTIAGTGFAASQAVSIYFNEVLTATTATDILGSFTISNFAIPATPAGTYSLRAQDVVGNSHSVTITTKQSIAIDPSSGPVGTKVTITGSGFKANDTITISLDNSVVTSSAGVSDATGRFGTIVDIPATPGGVHQLKAADSLSSDTKNFTVTATATASPSSGYVGTTISVAGSGFLANQTVTISFDSTGVKTVPADAQGGFSTSFAAPARTAGTYKIRATDGANFMDMDFTVTTSASITPTSASSPGYVGSSITVNGIGFQAGAALTVTFDGKQTATGTVGADSNFSLTFKAPAAKAGQHTITISDGSTTLPLDYFYMESTPPAAPSLIEPAAGVRAKTTPTLIWNPVVDQSSVTYVLQIANNTGFTSLVLEKTRLVSTEYTLTKEEKLQPAGKDNPYFWRVRAIDGASNEGNWSNVRSFMVGSAFPTWALWTLIGLGALIVLLFVYWLGRRAAVSRPSSTRLNE